MEKLMTVAEVKDRQIIRFVGSRLQSGTTIFEYTYIYKYPDSHNGYHVESHPAVVTSFD